MRRMDLSYDFIVPSPLITKDQGTARSGMECAPFSTDFLWCTHLGFLPCLRDDPDLALLTARSSVFRYCASKFCTMVFVSYFALLSFVPQWHAFNNNVLYSSDA